MNNKIPLCPKCNIRMEQAIKDDNEFKRIWRCIICFQEIERNNEWSDSENLMSIRSDIHLIRLLLEKMYFETELKTAAVLREKICNKFNDMKSVH